jgi:hypothetical protein
MPTTAAEIWKQLGLGDMFKDAEKRKIDEEIIKEVQERKDKAIWKGFPPGTKTAKGEPLFMRIK